MDRLAAKVEVTADALPEGEAAVVDMGRELFVTNATMRRRFGDPQLFGTASPLNPQLIGSSLEAACYTRDAAAIVERHVGDVYAAWQQ